MTFVYALIFVGILIFIHEMGHFLVAKIMRVRVKKFSIGFGPSILKIKKKGTEYAISLIPFGGYVRMLGETPDEKNQPDSYLSKPPSTRALIAFAGSFFNFISAVFLCIMLEMIGSDVPLPYVGEVMKGYPAEKAGILPGDFILEIEGTKIEVWSDIHRVVNQYGERELNFLVKRGEEIISFKITPVKEKDENEEGERFVVGIKSSPEKTKRIRKGFFGSIVSGTKTTFVISGATFKALWKLITGQIPASELRGPIFIMKTAGKAGKEGWRKFVYLLVLISVNLAIINLLPIPALDGGLIIISLIEIIARKDVPDKLRLAIQVFGFFLLFLIFLFVLYNDIVHALRGK
jgi:regulator of sigma E protease